MSTEDIQLREINKKGNFKALEINRNIFQKPPSISKSTISCAQFKEFNLHTNNLHYSKKFEKVKEQIESENA